MSTLSQTPRQNRNLTETFKFLVLTLHTPEAYSFIVSLANSSKNHRQLPHVLSCRASELIALLPNPHDHELQQQLIKWDLVSFFLSNKPSTRYDYERFIKI